MKRMWLLFALLFLLPLHGRAQLQVQADKSLLALGEGLRVTVQGAAGPACRYVLLRDGKTVFENKAGQPSGGVLHPRAAGVYTLIVSDGEEEAALSFTVGKGPGDSMDNAESTAFSVMAGAAALDGRVVYGDCRGDMLSFTVYAPGPWMARTEAPFIRLMGDCGADGDGITVELLPAEDGTEGEIVFACGGETRRVTVRAALMDARPEGAEEELSLSPIGDFVTVNEKESLSLCLNGGEAEIAVQASGPWAVEAADGFLVFDCTEDSLLLYAEENPQAAVREGYVTLACGLKRAYIRVYQPPAKAGPDVLSAALSRQEGTAWQDTVLARVETDADALQLQVSLSGHTETFPAEGFAIPVDGMLIWQVEMPLQAAGRQMILFSALGEGDAGRRQTAFVQVHEEPAAFIGTEAVFTLVGSRRTLQVETTSAAREVTLADGQGNALMTLGRENAAFAGPQGQEERYLAWRAEVPGEAVPAFAVMGEKQVPVTLKETLAPEEITLYSQTDGWWKDKKYSVSNLETSGCAVFSLAHALQLLGYEGEEIRPEKLAKTYAVALMKDGSGTMNSSLVGRAGDDFGFKTRYELIDNPGTIAARARQKAVFSFSVVNGHIACVAGVTEDGKWCRIIDSAPSATFERKGNVAVYCYGTDGRWMEAKTPADIPGTEYCLETDSYGAAVYYLDMQYVARRGVRLIQAP